MLGEERVMTFTKRYKDKDNKQNQFPVPLKPGSLLLMTKQTQDLLLHGIRKDGSKGRRISITGRWILPNRNKSVAKAQDEKFFLKDMMEMNEKLRTVVESEQRRGKEAP